MTQNSQNSASNRVQLDHRVAPTSVGLRLDKFVAQISDYSRSQVQDWIAQGKLLVNGKPQKPKYLLQVDDLLTLNAELEAHGTDLPEDIAIHKVYEDEDVLVIDKAVGMVVHTGAGNWTGTLVNALLFHYPNQASLPRAGLVHRIDKDTSGLLIIGKNHQAQQNLMDQLKEKSVYRHYQCVVAGDGQKLAHNRTINAPIARHPSQRIKMAVQAHGKPAITHLTKITELTDHYHLVDVALETGRTHQIRVHLSHIGCPLVGDPLYGGKNTLKSGLTQAQRHAVQTFPRQALHAHTLGFIHPRTGKPMQVVAPLPQDMQDLITVLQSDH